MSNILWRQALCPDLSHERERYPYGRDSGFHLGRTAAFLQRDEDLVELSDLRAYRFLSRAGLLLSALGLQASEVLKEFLEADPFSVGIYCAMEAGPSDYELARHMIDVPAEEFAQQYKNLRSAKQYFRELPNIPPSYLAVLLGILGPQYVYLDHRHGALHALEQAELDLNDGVVKAALVCSAFTVEDALSSMRVCYSIPKNTTLSEGAAVLLLTGNDQYSDWASMPVPCTYRFYGIAHRLVMLSGGR